MVGRRRGLRPAINSSDRWMRARAERAAINTPIQGSAADVASAAMLSIVQDKVLKELDWKLLLQVRMLVSCHTDLAFEGWIIGFGSEGCNSEHMQVACSLLPSNYMGSGPPLTWYAAHVELTNVFFESLIPPACLCCVLPPSPLLLPLFCCLSGSR